MSESNDTRDISFDFIYMKYGRLVMEIALRVLKNQHLAEDAFQEVILKISQNLDKLSRDSEKNKNYIINIARNTAISLYRQNKDIMEHEIPLETDDEDSDDMEHSRRHYKELSVESFENELFAKYDRIKVLNSLMKLDRKYSVYIKDYYFKRLSGKQIAEKHGISEDAAYKRIYRSVEKLKEIFMAEEA